MRILVVADFTTQPCGIRNFADQTVTALRRHPGLEVDTWDGYYPEIYRRREAQEATYLPDNAASYDVIHLNWHPIAFDTYSPSHFPFTRKPILSLYLHDIPPWSACQLGPHAQVRFSSEPSPGCVELPYPVADWVDLPPPDPGFSVGCSTIRTDGTALVRGICTSRQWEYREPDRTQGWRTFEAEVQRMARNTVNVLWYLQARGRSGGLSQAVSARRPVVCNDSPMFHHFRAYSDEIYFNDGYPPQAGLEPLLDRAYAQWEAGTLDARRPLRAAEALSWTRATGRMVEAWEAARR